MLGKDVSVKIGFAFDHIRWSDRTVEIIVANQTHTGGGAEQGNIGREDAELSRCPTLEGEEPTAASSQQVYRSVHVSSLVLVAQSEYFKSMFTNGMTETSQRTVRLVCESEQEALATWHLLKLLYYNNLTFAICDDDGCVHYKVLDVDVVDLPQLRIVADQYGVQGVVQACDEILGSRKSVHTSTRFGIIMEGLPKEVPLKLAESFNDSWLSDGMVEIVVANQMGTGDVYKTVHVSSVVLAALSEYFKTVFTNAMEESSQRTIQLVCESEQEALTTWQLLKVMYYNDIRAACSSGDVSDDVILQLMAVADKYRMSWFRDAYDKLLAGKQRSAAEWEALLAGWTKPSVIPNTQEACTKSLEEMFGVFESIWHCKSQRNAFLNLGVWVVQFLLDGDKVQARHENSVWTLVECWLLHQGLRQFSDLQEDHVRLLRSVRYHYMSPTFLTGVVKASPFMMDVSMMQMVTDALEWHNGKGSNADRWHGYCRRPMAETKQDEFWVENRELCSGTQTDGVLSKVYAFNLRVADKQLRQPDDIIFHERQWLINGYIFKVGLKLCNYQIVAFFALACDHHPPHGTLESCGLVSQCVPERLEQNERIIGSSNDPFIQVTTGWVGREFVRFLDFAHLLNAGNVYVKLILRFTEV